MDPYQAVFKALSDPTRLRIFAVLGGASFHQGELVGILGMAQSRVSRHLKILAEAGLVEARREGIFVWYSLTRRCRAKHRPAEAFGFLPPLVEELIHGEAFREDRAQAEYLVHERRMQAEEFFRGVADSWDEERDAVQGPPAHLDALLARLEPGADGPRGDPGDGEGLGTVVDLGTGTGVLLSRLSPRAETVIGIDAAREMLDVARDHAREAGLANVDLRLGALEHLPLPDASADAIVANMVLHHVANPPDAVAEVARGLRPGGRFLLADLAAHGEESYRERLGDLWLGFEPDALRNWLAEADLEVDEVESIPGLSERPDTLIVSAHKRAATENAKGDPA